jgi:hypothetical protein
MRVRYTFGTNLNRPCGAFVARPLVPYSCQPQGVRGDQPCAVLYVGDAMAPTAGVTRKTRSATISPSSKAFYPKKALDGDKSDKDIQTSWLTGLATTSRRFMADMSFAVGRLSSSTKLALSGKTGTRKSVAFKSAMTQPGRFEVATCTHAPGWDGVRLRSTDERGALRRVGGRRADGWQGAGGREDGE